MSSITFCPIETSSNVCWSHLINDGITVTGDSVLVEWQGTGPSEGPRITQFTCSLDNQPAEICEHTDDNNEVKPTDFFVLLLSPRVNDEGFSNHPLTNINAA